MARATIDFGIDLGTTNSEIACFEGESIRIFKNNSDNDATPSAVSMNDRGEITVGAKAKQRAEEDRDNAKSEFKRLMGTQESLHFAKANKTLTPIELSAEVLKSLRGDVFHRTGEEVVSAVITVPAMFELPACDATRKAAALAGIEYSQQLQEPIAAALAYGFQADAQKKAFWLIYDLGGGTFDASLMSVRDGALAVVDNAGDNYLGGKDFDWAIVDFTLKQLRSEYDLAAMKRDDKRFLSAFAKLKGACEEAKIGLSRRNSVSIECDNLCQDGRGKSVDVNCDLSSQQLESLMTPFLERTLSICRDLIKRNHLSPNDIERLVLVGGPTLSPILRDFLKSELGIFTDYKVDPITIVAQGAAIYAGAQKNPVGRRDRAQGQFNIELQYEPVTQETEPFAAGKVVNSSTGAPPEAGYEIEFARADNTWRSGKIPIKANGAVFTTLSARERKANAYSIALYDPTGIQVSISPDSFKITHGMTLSGIPLPRSLGVALAGDELRVYLKKGSSLPTKQKCKHSTTKEVKRGSAEDALRIPVVEGEHPKASRNRLIYNLVIPGTRFSRDLPAESEVEVAIEVDESRKVTARAYIPLLDEEFEEVFEGLATHLDADALQKRLDAERERLREAQKTQRENYDPEVNSALEKIEREQSPDSVQKGVSAAKGGDADAREQAERQILDLQAALDAVDAKLEWPRVEREAIEELNYTRLRVKEWGDSDEKRQLTLLEEEVNQAIAQKNAEALKALSESVVSLGVKASLKDPSFWIGLLNSLKGRISSMTDSQAAQRLAAAGERAVRENNIPALKDVARQLVDLLPADEKGDFASNYGGTLR